MSYHLIIKSVYICAKFNILKIFLNILLLTIILSYQFKDIVVYVNFKINQSYIANNLCENINKPYLSCNGKCVLRQQIVSLEEQESENLPIEVKAPTSQVYCIPVLKQLFLSVLDLQDNPFLHFYDRPIYVSSFVKDLLRPPQFFFSA